MALFETQFKISRLQDYFIVPPFSYLDTKMKYWQDRRNAWTKVISDATQTRDDKFGRVFGVLPAIEKRTSTFDPVLAELMYLWFCPENAKVLDVFGGEQVKGIVAGALGYDYCGVEIRQEQVDLNRKLAKDYPKVKYYCGDSTQVDQIVSDRDFTFFFTSPPYFDLEVYSNDKSDISTKRSYEDFLNDLETIFKKSYDMMLDDTFAVVKVGEVRGKNQEFLGFVPDTVNIMKRCGWKYYNEIILLNSIASGCVRASRQMKSRKIVKLHQNVLVFYKGDIANIINKFPDLRGKDDV